MTEPISILLTVLSSLCASLGQLGLKFGSIKLEKRFKALITNYALMAGLFFYGISSVLFIIALKGGELTVLFPIASLNYIWVDLLAIKYLNEKMNKLKWFGILLILVGVVVII